MKRFKRAYVVSVVILCTICVLFILGNLGSGQYAVGYSIVPIVISAIALFPIFRSGGLATHPRLPIGISAFFAIGFVGLLGFAFIEFIRSKGGEGPNGEGAPGALIIAMAFFAVAFVCPWLLTLFRGLPLWNHHDALDKFAPSEDL